jgi:hypothetical protein
MANNLTNHNKTTFEPKKKKKTPYHTSSWSVVSAFETALALACFRTVPSWKECSMKSIAAPSSTSVRIPPRHERCFEKKKKKKKNEQEIKKVRMELHEKQVVPFHKEMILIGVWKSFVRIRENNARRLISKQKER